jgi:phage replication O-like protein O
MRSPQIENGHTRIANELLEAMMHFDFSKRQYKVLLAVIRKTYGYGKKEDDLGITQLAKLTGLDPAHAARTVRELVSMGVLIRREGRYAHVISLEKDYSHWGMAETATQAMAKTAIRGGQNSQRTMAKTATLGWPKQPPQNKTPKENSKRKPPLQLEIDANTDQKEKCGGGDVLFFETDETTAKGSGSAVSKKLASVPQSDLIYPKSLTAQEQQAAEQLLCNCNGHAQDILDTLEAAIQAGQVKKSPLALLGGMVRRYEAGTFDPTPGLHIAENRSKMLTARKKVETLVHVDGNAVLRELEALRELQQTRKQSEAAR